MKFRIGEWREKYNIWEKLLNCELNVLEINRGNYKGESESELIKKEDVMRMYNTLIREDMGTLTNKKEHRIRGKNQKQITNWGKNLRTNRHAIRENKDGGANGYKYKSDVN